MFKVLKLQLEGVQMQERLVEAPVMVAPEMQRGKNPVPRLSDEALADSADEAYYTSIARGM